MTPGACPVLYNSELDRRAVSLTHAEEPYCICLAQLLIHCVQNGSYFLFKVIIQIFINATIAGALIITALTMVFETAQPLVIWGLIGFVLSVLAYWSVALGATRVLGLQKETRRGSAPGSWGGEITIKQDAKCLRDLALMSSPGVIVP